MAQREFKLASLLDLLAILLLLLLEEDVDLWILVLGEVVKRLELLQPIVSHCDHPLCRCDLGLRVAEVHDLLEVLFTPSFMFVEDDGPEEMTIIKVHPLIVNFIGDVSHEFKFILDVRYHVDSCELRILTYGRRIFFDLV